MDYIQAFRNGYCGRMINGCQCDVIDDMVEQWHNRESDDDLPMHEFLGFDEHEFTLWIERPHLLACIVKNKFD